MTSEERRNTSTLLIAQSALATVVLIAAIVGLATGNGAPLNVTSTFDALRTHSYRFAIEQQVTGPETTTSPVADFGFSIRGAFDAESERSELVMTFNNPALKASCTYVGKGSDFYVRVHESRRAELGADWIHTDAKNVLQALTVARTFERLHESGDLYEGLVADGSEEVRGVDTTRYRGKVRVADLFEGSTAPSTQARQFPIEIFVDDDGLPRRTTIEFKPSETSDFGSKVIQDFYDFDRVTVAKPTNVREGDAKLATLACFEKSLDTGFPGTGFDR